MPYAYGVLGAGRQGTAAAFDLARFGEAKTILLGDRDLAIARQAADRVNGLLRVRRVEPRWVDTRDADSVAAILRDVDAIVSAVPYTENVALSEIAVATKCSMCDLGGNLEIALRQHAFDADAKRPGISLIPNCGQVPGMDGAYDRVERRDCRAEDGAGRPTQGSRGRRTAGSGTRLRRRAAAARILAPGRDLPFAPVAVRECSSKRYMADPFRIGS